MEGVLTVLLTNSARLFGSPPWLPWEGWEGWEEDQESSSLSSKPEDESLYN